MKKFKDINWEPQCDFKGNVYGFHGKLRINGHILSVICGRGTYTTENLSAKIEEHDCFEIATWNEINNKWTTQLWFEDLFDNVKGWVNISEIEKLIQKIENQKEK